jgi:DNA mismatch repair protein MutS2
VVPSAGAGYSGHVRAQNLAALELGQVLDRLAGFARSTAAQEACRGLTPLCQPAAVEQALEAAWQCTRLIDEHGDLPLGEFPDIRTALREAAHEGFVLNGRSLVEVRTVLAEASAVRAFLTKHTRAYPALAHLPEGLLPPPSLQAALQRALDDNGGVTDDASEELAAVRRDMRQIRTRLARRLEDLLGQTAMAEVVADRYVTLRNNRFVVPIKSAAAAQFKGVVQDRSVSGETTFIEPLFAVELNNRLLIAAREEEALARRVLADLTDLVRAEHAALAATFATLVQIDALAARARFAQRYRCTKPVLDDQELLLADARHPLLLFTERAVTPVDLRLPRGKRVLLITGPNTGGKSVAVKTLGLLALMAQSGVLIPAAEGARLPCFGGIYADVGDEQSIERNLSTFSAHVANLAEIIATHETPALVLLDEPGVGTDPDDGAALGIGMIRTLEASGARVVVSTHYLPLKVFALGHETCVAAAVDFDLERMAPRYRLIYHSVGESLALPIARRLGLPAAVLEAAESARSEQARALGAALAQLEASRRRYEERLQDVETGARAAAAAEEEAALLLAELRAQRRRRWADELQAARAFVRNVRAQGRELLAAIEAGAADRRTLMRFVEEQEATIAAREAAVAAPLPASDPPQVGDQVQVGETAVRGVLLAVDGARAWVQRGSMRFEVPAGQLRRLDGAPGQPVSIRVHAAAADAPAEITLLGLRAREAVEQLETFLDRAVRARHPSVRIVHGIGSGALRRAVTEYLTHSPYCAAFRTAAPGEGGSGVTVAELAAG